MEIILVALKTGQFRVRSEHIFGYVNLFTGHFAYCLIIRFHPVFAFHFLQNRDSGLFNLDRGSFHKITYYTIAIAILLSLAATIRKEIAAAKVAA